MPLLARQPKHLLHLGRRFAVLVGAGALTFFGCAFLLGVVNRDTVGQLRRRKL